MERVPFSGVPEPYKTLLVHSDHMTAMMERFHGSPVDVRVLDRNLHGMAYSRKTLLVRRDSGKVVQFAFAQLDLSILSAAVRQAILNEQEPLGRVFTHHKLRCQIDVEAIIKVTLGRDLSKLFLRPVNELTYGRIAHILCNGKSGCDVIEIAAPTI
jgi:hypothetical protein